MNYKGKVVIVAGASSGIGAAIAFKFSLCGATVVIVGRNENRLSNVFSKIQTNAKTSKVLVIKADVTKDDDVKRIINETIEKYEKLDVLVNNAGIFDLQSILSENAMQTFDKIIAVNLRSVVHLTNLAAPYLIKTKGNIINISSITSKALCSSKNFPYCTSKAGLDHFTRAVAYELSEYGVRVNTVNPGPVKTNFMDNMGLNKEDQEKLLNRMINTTTLGKMSEPEEVADLVSFLASDMARSITGASYTIDNGALLKSNDIEIL